MQQEKRLESRRDTPVWWEEDLDVNTHTHLERVRRFLRKKA